MSKEEFAPFLRNFVFGVEDSLVSTVGMLSGIAAAGQSATAVVTAGIVLVFVEAFSMSAGTIISDNSVEEFERGKEQPLSRSYGEGATMFFSYFIAGFIPIAPYVAFDNGTAFYVSISASLIALFLLGTFSGRLASISPAREGFKMFLIGGIAILLGVIVGTLLGR